MNIFIHELKRNLRTAALWMAVVTIAGFFFFSIYPAFSKDVDVLMAFIKKFPEPVRKAMQLDIDIISSVTGFFSFIATYLVLCGAVQALSLGLFLTAREVTGKTLEFLLTKPVSRESVLTQKILAGLCCLLAANIWYFLVVTMAAVSTGAEIKSFSVFALIAGSFGFVQIIFFTGGFFAGVFFRKIKSPLSVTLTTCFALFIVNLFSNAIEDVDPRLFSPFAYINYESVMKTGAYEIPYMVLGLLITAAFIAGAYLVFRKKDFAF